jgi:protein-S-isoprenylcysteine O-methyltransferase Ste14
MKTKKLIILPFVLLYFDSIVLVILFNGLMQIQKIIPLVILNVFFFIDILIRYTSEKKDKFNRIIIIASFFLFPLLIAAPYIESIYLYLNDTLIFSFITTLGLIFEICGGLILFYSRKSIGKYGTSSVAIEDNHKLLTKGMYKYSRNPIYLGIILLLTGYGISLSSIISTIFLFIFLVVILLSRMKQEEQILEESFGKEYLEYKKKTKRFIPFIY